MPEIPQVVRHSFDMAVDAVERFAPPMQEIPAEENPRARFIVETPAQLQAKRARDIAHAKLRIGELVTPFEIMNACGLEPRVLIAHTPETSIVDPPADWQGRFGRAGKRYVVDKLLEPVGQFRIPRKCVDPVVGIRISTWYATVIGTKRLDAMSDRTAIRGLIGKFRNHGLQNSHENHLRASSSELAMAYLTGVLAVQGVAEDWFVRDRLVIEGRPLRGPRTLQLGVTMCAAVRPSQHVDLTQINMGDSFYDGHRGHPLLIPPKSTPETFILTTHPRGQRLIAPTFGQLHITSML